MPSSRKIAEYLPRVMAYLSHTSCRGHWRRSDLLAYRMFAADAANVAGPPCQLHNGRSDIRPSFHRRRLLPFMSAGTLLMLLMLGCAVREPMPADTPATGTVQEELTPSPRPPLRVAHWQDMTQHLTDALAQRGYIVQTGQVRFFEPEDCLAVENCVGNNPSSPYGMYCLPPAPGDTVARHAEPPCPPNSNLRWVWRLRPDEALVFLGKTPPPSRYFSFRSYLFSRQGWFRRRPLFASLGDTLNLEVIATAGTPHGAAGKPFMEETVVISTADRRLDTTLRELLTSHGAPEAIINTDILPAALTHLGLEESSDDFAMLFRVALFTDPAAGQRYVQDPPATILRVTPGTASMIDPFPVPVPPLRRPGTHTSEAWLRPALDELIAAVKARYPHLTVRKRRTITFDLSGRQCLERGLPCLGDNPDTMYNSSIPTWLSDSAQDFLIVVGINHQKTGKARYLNLAVYHTKRLMGVGAVTDREVADSANLYLPQHPLQSYLYAYKFARDCQGEPFCFSVPTGQLGVPFDEALNMIERPYLEPLTHTGPLVSQLVHPQVLHFCPSFTILGACDP